MICLGVQSSWVFQVFLNLKIVKFHHFWKILAINYQFTYHFIPFFLSFWKSDYIYKILLLCPPFCLPSFPISYPFAFLGCILGNFFIFALIFHNLIPLWLNQTIYTCFLSYVWNTKYLKSLHVWFLTFTISIDSLIMIFFSVYIGNIDYEVFTMKFSIFFLFTIMV